jgi:hypothetical protein
VLKSELLKSPNVSPVPFLIAGLPLPGGSPFASNVLQLGIIAAEVGLQQKVSNVRFRTFILPTKERWGRALLVEA